MILVVMVFLNNNFKKYYSWGDPLGRKFSLATAINSTLITRTQFSAKNFIYSFYFSLFKILFSLFKVVYVKKSTNNKPDRQLNTIAHKMDIRFFTNKKINNDLAVI